MVFLPRGFLHAPRFPSVPSHTRVLSCHQEGWGPPSPHRQEPRWDMILAGPLHREPEEDLELRPSCLSLLTPLAAPSGERGGALGGSRGRRVSPGAVEGAWPGMPQSQPAGLQAVCLGVCVCVSACTAPVSVSLHACLPVSHASVWVFAHRYVSFHRCPCMCGRLACMCVCVACFARLCAHVSV